jgi:O-methyltransferase
MINLKLEFLKRILTDSTNNEEVYQNYLKKAEFPSESILKTIIASPVQANRNNGSDWPERAHTMIGMLRLNNLHNCLDEVRKNNIEGDFIETGVWRGGACIFVKKYFQLHGMNKKVFVADSFEGLPKPEHPEDEGDHHHTMKFLQVSLDEVKNNFSLHQALDENVIFLKGWFSDTLPNNQQIKKLCILRMDGDMYKSTMDVFESCYHKVENKGFVIIDDYSAVRGCQRATILFRERNKIEKELTHIDGCGVYWQKFNLLF